MVRLSAGDSVLRLFLVVCLFFFLSSISVLSPCLGDVPLASLGVCSLASHGRLFSTRWEANDGIENDATWLRMDMA